MVGFTKSNFRQLEKVIFQILDECRKLALEGHPQFGAFQYLGKSGVWRVKHRRKVTEIQIEGHW
jgi:hypothetical protein